MGCKSSNENARLLQMDLDEFCEIVEKCGAKCQSYENNTNYRKYHTFDKLEDIETAITMLKIMNV